MLVCICTFVHPGTCIHTRARAFCVSSVHDAPCVTSTSRKRARVCACVRVDAHASVSARVYVYVCVYFPTHAHTHASNHTHAALLAHRKTPPSAPTLTMVCWSGEILTRCTAPEWPSPTALGTPSS